LISNHKPLDTLVVTVISEVTGTGVVVDTVAGMIVDLLEAAMATEVVVLGTVMVQLVTIVTRVLAILDTHMVTMATRSQTTMT